MKYHEVPLVVRDEDGVHMRPAKAIAELAQTYPHEILLYRPAGPGKNGKMREEDTADAKSPLGILTLCAQEGTVLTLKVSTNRPGYEGAAQAIKELFDAGFGYHEHEPKPAEQRAPVRA